MVSPDTCIARRRPSNAISIGIMVLFLSKTPWGCDGIQRAHQTHNWLGRTDTWNMIVQSLNELCSIKRLVHVLRTRAVGYSIVYIQDVAIVDDIHWRVRSFVYIDDRRCCIRFCFLGYVVLIFCTDFSYQQDYLYIALRSIIRVHSAIPYFPQRQ